MATFFGRDVTKEACRGLAGRDDHYAGVTEFILSSGKANGVRAARIRTGSGFDFTVLAGRGMDICEAYMMGVPIHYSTSTGVTSAAYYESFGREWLRSFFGGLLTTCGILYCGEDSRDDQREYGLHGRVSNSEADDVSIIRAWHGDSYRLGVSGVVREASFAGERVTLSRRIDTEMGRSGFTLTDIIENSGFRRQPCMLMYHFNFGYPLLGRNARFVAPVISTTGFDDYTASGADSYDRFSEPADDIFRYLFLHELRPANDGIVSLAVVNPLTEIGIPLGVVIRYRLDDLPKLSHLKWTQRGTYITALEPGTVDVRGRKYHADHDLIPYLESQERRTIRIDIDIVTNQKEVDELANLKYSAVNR